MLLFLRFLPEFRSSKIFAVTEHTRNQFFFRYPKKNFLRYPTKFFLQKVHFGLIRWVPKWVFKISIFIVEICILIWDFLVISKIIACACWAYAETILSHTEHTRKRFHRTLSIRACSASGKMWTVFTCKSMLSIRGTNFIAHWAYAKWISSLAEHMRDGLHSWLSKRGNQIRFSKISC